MPNRREFRSKIYSAQFSEKYYAIKNGKIAKYAKKWRDNTVVNEISM